MKDDYSDFAAMRADLMRDFNPANAQERLLVLEVASAWRRLVQARGREELFFDLQRHSLAIRDGKPPADYQKDGVEVAMWLDKPNRSYDQILRAIRDAEMAFDRSIRRIEAMTGKRYGRERLAQRDAQSNELNAAKINAVRARSAATVPRSRTRAAGARVVEMPVTNSA